MGRIVLLDEHTANKIAAGEVVERPASVVKELVENSIDAGSTRIEISITEGGLKEISVSDNGAGMDSDDAVIAFNRHATSKIKTSEDLEGIVTLGFRGEALASIAAVSKLSLKTKTHDSVAGTEVVIDGGKIIATVETGCPDGTIIKINDLFFNTPARKKHMKSPVTEAGHISSLVNKIAMGYPEISFQLKANNKVVFKTSGNGNLLESIANIYGSDLARELLSVVTNDESTSVSGFVGKPSITRSGRTHQVIYINGRYVRDRFISEAVEKAYHSMLMTGRYPVFILHILTDPGLVDVNVHPAKTIVRIADLDSLEGIVFEAVRRTLSSNSLIPKNIQAPKIKTTPVKTVQEELKMQGLQLKQPDMVRQSFDAKPSVSRANQPISDVKPSSNSESLIVDDPVVDIDSDLSPDTSSDTASDSAFGPASVSGSDASSDLTAASVTEQYTDTDVVSDLSGSYNYSEIPEDAMENAFPELRPIGQIDSTYIVAQGLDGMYIIDQHAAHERVLYEKYISNPREYTTSVQLLFPETIQLTHQESQFIIEAINTLAELGFVVEHFGGNAYLLRAVPASVSTKNIKEIFLGLLDYFSHNRYTISGKALEEKFIITMACKNAIKANERLGFPEMESLISQLAAVKQPYTCPHGRPTITHFSGYDLEKLFKRVL